MNRQNLINRILTGTGIMLTMALVHAGTPLLTFLPLTDTNTAISSGAHAIVKYEVTNQSKKSHTLSLVQQKGITQVIKSNACTAPFTLSAKTSCTLYLDVTNNAISDGPVICQSNPNGTPNPNQCYQPSPADRLHTTKASPFLYAVNSVQTPALGWLVKCPINTDGVLSPCVSIETTGYSVIDPVSIALNPDKTMAYIGEFNNSNDVIRCPINLDGSFGPCVGSGNTGVPFEGISAVVLNSPGNIAYVTNENNGTMSICPIMDDGSFGACVYSTAFGTQPVADGVVFNTKRDIAYVTTYQDLTRCSVKQDGSFDTCTVDVLMGVTPGYLVGITLNSAGNKAYIADYFSNAVYICPVNTDGMLGTCTDSGNTGVPLLIPTTVTFNLKENIAYISQNSNMIIECPVLQDGSFGACTNSKSGVLYPWLGTLLNE